MIYMADGPCQICGLDEGGFWPHHHSATDLICYGCWLWIDRLWRTYAFLREG